MSKKKIKDNNPDIYGELVDFQDRLHAQNLKRIRIGLLCVIVIPMIFLALMFITDSNKVIWLILWIVSLFAISAYLIVVEYGDYNLQHRINSITGNEAEPVGLLESGMNGVNEKLISMKTEARDIITSAKDSMDIDEPKKSHGKRKNSDVYSSQIDTDIIEESLSEHNGLDDEAASETRGDKDSNSKTKKKDNKKDKKDKKSSDKKKKDKDKKEKKKNNNKKDKDKKKDKENKLDKKSDDNNFNGNNNNSYDDEDLKKNYSKKAKNSKDKKDKKNKDKKKNPSTSSSQKISINETDNKNYDTQNDISKNMILNNNTAKEEALDE